MLKFAVACAFTLHGVAPAFAQDDHERRIRLDRGTALIVDNFLPEHVIQELRAVLDRLHEMDALQHNYATGAECYQCTVVSGSLTPSLEEICQDIILDGQQEYHGLTGTSSGTFALGKAMDWVVPHIRSYANKRIELNSSLVGNFAFKGAIHPDLAVLRRYPATATDPNEGGLHLDTDFDGRCLSSLLFLNTAQAGSLRLYKCKDGEEHLCTGLQGQKTVRAIVDDYIVKPENMLVTAEVQPVAGRLVFFLSETVHSVAQFSEARDVLLVWSSCKDWSSTQNMWLRRNHKEFVLNPYNSWAVDAGVVEQIIAGVDNGRMVKISNALLPEEAEILYQELLEVNMSRWQHNVVMEPGRQVSRHVLTCDLYGAHCPLSVGYLHRLLSHQLQFWTQFANVTLGNWSSSQFGHEAVVATWYRHGDFMTPHTDLESRCGLSYILMMTKDWRPEWGGSLWWMQRQGPTEYPPDFNALFLFQPSALSMHMVSPVLGDDGRRFAISGCFLTAGAASGQA